MNKNKLRLISAVLALMMLLPLLFACGSNDPDDTQSGTTAQQENQTNEQGLPANTEEERIQPDLPDDVNYNGHVFKILTFGVAGSYEWEQADLTYSEVNDGDVINDAVFARNKVVEDKYGVVIEEVHLYDADFGSSLKKEISAGTTEYDLVSPRVIDSAGHMSAGYFKNLFDLEYIDLEKPWYDQKSVQEMSIDNKLFIVLSDALLSDDNATTITIFNKKLIENYQLENPYTLVKEGKWTVDKLYEMAKATAKDLDSDGKLSPDVDQFGYLMWGDSMISFLHSGGQRLVSKDSDDLPVLAFNTAATYDAMDKAMNLLYDVSVTGNVQLEAFSTWSQTPFDDIFTSDRAAFSWLRLLWIPKLRGMDTDFGILPIPKINESNDTVYHSTVNVHTACALAVPNTPGDTERTAIIMEALSAESKYTLVPAYYEKNLLTKLARDDDSSDMLDIILSNKVLDIGDVYNFADFGIEFYRLPSKNDRNLVSFFEKYEPRVNKELVKLTEKIQGLD